MIIPENQFGDSSQWDLLYSNTFTAESVNQSIERYFPIPPYTVPVQASGRFVMAYAYSQEAQPHWRYAGRLLFKISTGVTTNGGAPQTTIKVGKIYLNQFEIISVPPFSSSYSITIEIPYWHREIFISIYEYIGDNRNTVHAKLDELLLQHP